MRTKRNAPNKFPLRLMPSMRKGAEQFSAREGVSLNQFINIAIAEKLAHLEHQEWLNRRRLVTESSLAAALKILDRAGKQPPEPGDELPEEYLRLSLKPQSVTKSGAARKTRKSRDFF
jgi:hypothetical protein